MTHKILITGGSGFIASHVVAECLDRGHSIYLQTRSDTLPMPSACRESITILKGSFLDLRPDSLVSVDSIIHLASAGVSPRKEEWSELEKINIAGTLHMCALASDIEAKLVIAGSYSEYGRSGMRYNEIPVDAPMAPTFPYAISKAASCQLALGYARAEYMYLAYLRIFNAFGDFQHESNLWPSLLKSAKSGHDYEMTKGEQIRDFVDVKDVACQLIDSATRIELKKGSPFVANVGSGKPQSVRQFCEYWWKKSNAKGNLKIGHLPYRENEVMRYVPSMKTAYL